MPNNFSLSNILSSILPQTAVKQTSVGPEGTIPINYIYNDQFLVNESSPMVSPRTAQPGPGTAVLIDTGNKMSISASRLLLTTMTITNSDPKYTSTTSKATQNGDVWRLLWRQTSNGIFAIKVGGYDMRSSLGAYQLNNAGIGSSYLSFPSIPYNNDYRWYVIYATDIFFILYTNSTYYLTGVGVPFQTMDVAQLSPGNQNIGLSMASISCGRLGGNFADRNYFAVDYKTSPLAGNTINANADGCIRADWTSQAGQVLDIQFRRTDDNNCLIARCDINSNKLFIYEKQGGVETEKGTVGGRSVTWGTNKTQQMTIYTSGQNVSVCISNNNGQTGGILNFYSTASFNQTATGAKTNMNLTRLASYPTTISADKLSHPFFT